MFGMKIVAGILFCFMTPAAISLLQHLSPLLLPLLVAAVAVMQQSCCKQYCHPILHYPCCYPFLYLGCIGTHQCSIYLTLFESLLDFARVWFKRQEEEGFCLKEEGLCLNNKEKKQQDCLREVVLIASVVGSVIGGQAYESDVMHVTKSQTGSYSLPINL